MMPPSKEGRDKFDVDRGHGIARALETVLKAQREDKAQDVSLVYLYISFLINRIYYIVRERSRNDYNQHY
jgi:hypothetical protein